MDKQQQIAEANEQIKLAKAGMEKELAKKDMPGKWVNQSVFQFHQMALLHWRRELIKLTGEIEQENAS